MKSELVPLNGDPPIPITRDLTVIGRRDYCDVVIPLSSLSKRHCVVVRTDGLLMLRDLATTNGTKVNGQRISWAALLPNDRVNIGGYKVRVYLGPDDAPSPSEQQEGASSDTFLDRVVAPSQRVPEAEDDGGLLNFAAPTPDEGTPSPIATERPASPASSQGVVVIEEDDPPDAADIFAQLQLEADDRVLDLD